ncbi:diguanylate cyclase [Thalassotalea fusca]
MANIECKDAKVLIVDDTRANIDLLLKMLEPEGYKLSFAMNGEQALNIASLAKPDIILLDVMMPEMDGIECCRRLKANSDTSDIPVIFVTAKTETQDIVNGFDAGAVDYVIKPVRRAEVCARVKTHINLRYLVRQRDNLINSITRYAEHIHNIIEQVNNPIITFNTELTINYANPAAIKAFGYELHILLSNKLTHIFPATEHEKIQTFGLPIIENDAPAKTIQTKGKTQDGSVFYMDLMIAPLGGDSDEFVALMHDTSSHKKTEHDLLKLSGLDPLTGIFNRRGFDLAFEREWRDAAREHSELSLIMIDVDFFKAYNDHLGHLEGDHCLVNIANLFEECSKRPKDIVARFGGEEFIVLLSNTPIEGAIQFAHSIQEKLHTMNLPHPDSSVSDRVTISMGVGCIIPDNSKCAEAFIEAVDKTMYLAKEQGRNRVVAMPFDSEG